MISSLPSFFSAQPLVKSLSLALVMFISFLPVHAQRNIDSLRQTLELQKDVTRIGTLNELAVVYLDVDTDSAMFFALQAMEESNSFNSHVDRIKSRFILGEIYLKKDDYASALQHFNSALNEAISIDELFLVAKGHLLIARYHQQTDAPRKAIEHLNKTIVATSGNDFKALTANAYALLGANYYRLSLYKSALDYYFKALRIYEVLNDTGEIARTFNSIGRVYQRTDDYDDALDYLLKALEINESRNDANAVLSNIINIGVIYQKRDDFDNALNYYRKALSMAKEVGNRRYEAIITGNIGSTLVEQKKLEGGLEYLNRALALKEGVSSYGSILHTLNDIADVKILLNDAEGARQAAEKVVNLGLKHEESDQLRYGYLNLSKSYKLLKDFEKAHAYLEKYNAINDSLFNIEKAQQINELEIQYETEKKDQAIRSLKQQKELADSQRKIYILIAVIILLVLVALYFSQRLKTRKNRQLLEKEKEVDRLKSNFFANISHEFRTPLTLILGPLESILPKVQDPHQRHQLGLMKKSAARLLRLINQILDLSKLESGHLELKASEVDMVQVARGVTGSFQSLADSKDITLAFKTIEPVLSVYCDQAHIETILINLISNAFKFTEAGGTINVSLDKSTSGFLEIAVADSGAGISPDQVEHIFDRFYQAGSSSLKQFGGTGIGLALTKELVELHGGEIHVNSELGQGTTVTVTMPLGKAHLREDQIVGQQNVEKSEQSHLDELAVDADPVSTEASARGVDNKPLILLVEDNEDVRSYVRSILKDDYQLIVAINGEEGVQAAKEHIPDLIISDVMMPKMNGYNACRMIKQDEKTSHIPVILLTAKASVNSRIQGLETEADLYLSKPFVPKELLLCIHNLIQSRRKLRERYNRQVVLKPSDIAINSVDEQFLQRLMKIVEDHHEDENFSVDQLSREIGMSRSQLHRKLQALTNESSSEFIRSFRLQRAMELLKKNYASVSEIAFKVGFASHSYFNKCFLKHYGCTPSSVLEGSADSARPEAREV